jgi:hypothetical protein
MDIDALRPLLSGLLGALVVGVLVARMRRSKAVEHDGVLILRYPRALGYFGFVLGVIFGAFAVRNARYGSSVSSYAVALLVPLVLALVGVYIAAEVFLSRVIVSNESVLVSSPLGTRTALWPDIVRIEFVPTSGWYVLYTSEGNRLRVSSLLPGISRFLERAADAGLALPSND